MRSFSYLMPDSITVDDGRLVGGRRLQVDEHLAYMIEDVIYSKKVNAKGIEGINSVNICSHEGTYCDKSGHRSGTSLRGFGMAVVIDKINGQSIAESIEDEAFLRTRVRKLQERFAAHSYVFECYGPCLNIRVEAHSPSKQRSVPEMKKIYHDRIYISTTGIQGR